MYSSVPVEEAAPPPLLPQLKKLWHPAKVGFKSHLLLLNEGFSVQQA